MHTSQRRVAYLLAAALAAGCSTANMTSYSPVSEKTKFSSESLHRAARDAAEHLGYRPRGDDAGSEIIDTREKEVAVSSVPRLSYKYSFHIETTSGLLSINALCTKNSATSEKTFSDCGSDRPARVVDELGLLRKRILELAATVEARTPDWKGFGETTSPADAGASATKPAEPAPKPKGRTTPKKK